MRKFLFLFLLSFAILLPQASAATLVDVGAERLYKEMVAINNELDAKSKMQLSDLHEGESANEYEFYLSQGKKHVIASMEVAPNGYVEKIAWVGTDDGKNLFGLSSALIMTSVGLTEDEATYLLDEGNLVKEGEMLYSAVNATNMKRVVLLVILPFENNQMGFGLFAI